MRERNHSDECTKPLDDAHTERGEQCPKKRAKSKPRQISVRGDTHARLVKEARAAETSISELVDRLVKASLDAVEAKR